MPRQGRTARIITKMIPVPIGRVVNRVSAVAGERRMQVADIANLSGLPYQTVQRHWRDEAAGIDFVTLARLCDVLTCQPADLYVYDDTVVIDESTSADNGS